MLKEIIQYEPSELFDKELLGRLATLGIEKGKPFNPDERMCGEYGWLCGYLLRTHSGTGRQVEKPDQD